jgi:hypothetical protein
VSNSKGNATFYLPKSSKYPKTAVQITTNGFVKIHGGTKRIDKPILKILRPDVVTTNSRPFSWKRPKETKGEKELRKDRPLERSRAVLKSALKQLEEKLNGYVRAHKSFNGSEPNSAEVNDARLLLNFLRPKVNKIRSITTISKYLLKVQDAVDYIDDQWSIISQLMEEVAYESQRPG